jgi:sulfite reductase beta subunit-like hemoprotein
MIREQKEKNRELIEKTISYLEMKNFEDIRADLPGYTSPKSFVKKKDGINIVADLSAKKEGRKYFFDIGLKSQKFRLLKSKWLLLDAVAQSKSNYFRIITTRGHIQFTQKLLQEVNLSHKTLIKI